jgi:hypothetical protein
VEVARVVLPTGAAYEYDWTNGLAGTTYPVVETPPGILAAVYRRLGERREYVNGATGANWTRRTVYAVTPHNQDNTLEDPLQGGTSPHRCAANWCTEVAVTESGIGPSLGQETLGVERHFYYGSPADPAELLYPLPIQYSAWPEGREFRTTWETETNFDDTGAFSCASFGLNYATAAILFLRSLVDSARNSSVNAVIPRGPESCLNKVAGSLPIQVPVTVSMPPNSVSVFGEL